MTIRYARILFATFTQLLFGSINIAIDHLQKYGGWGGGGGLWGLGLGYSHVGNDLTLFQMHAFQHFVSGIENVGSC